MLAKLQLEAENLQHLEAPLLMTLAWQTLGGPKRVFSRTFPAIVMVATVVIWSCSLECFWNHLTSRMILVHWYLKYNAKSMCAFAHRVFAHQLPCFLQVVGGKTQRCSSSRCAGSQEAQWRRQFRPSSSGGIETIFHVKPLEYHPNNSCRYEMLWTDWDWIEVEVIR